MKNVTENFVIQEDRAWKPLPKSVIMKHIRSVNHYEDWNP